MSTRWIRKPDSHELAGSVSSAGLAGPTSTGPVYVYTGRHAPGTADCGCTDCGMARNGFEPSAAPGREVKSQVRATLDRRRSNAAGTHGDRRTKRLKTRGSRIRASLRDFD